MDDEEVTPRRRLVVELTDATTSDLTRLVDQEILNKTTIANRAIQLYALLRDNEIAGGMTLIRTPDGETQRLILL